MRYRIGLPLAALAGGLCAASLALRTARAERAADGIARIERAVAARHLPPHAADAFRAQMAVRLAASGADRAAVEAWLARTVSAPVAQPPHVAAAADSAPDSAPETAAPDYSKLTPEEREVIGMNANYIHATRLNNRP